MFETNPKVTRFGKVDGTFLFFCVFSERPLLVPPDFQKKGILFPWKFKIRMNIGQPM